MLFYLLIGLLTCCLLYLIDLTFQILDEADPTFHEKNS